MFTRIGQFTVRRRRRRRRLVLILTVALVVVAGALGGAVFDRLSTGGFEDPDSESARAADLLDEQFGAGAPNVVLLVTAEDGDVDAAAVAAVGLELTQQLAAYPKADDVVSYWSLGSPPPLRSEDGSAALVVGRLAGEEDEWQVAGEGLDEAFAGDRGPVTVEVGGSVEIFNQVGETIESDLARAESVAIPITLILLIIVFGGIVAALLPVGVGMLAVLGAFFVLWLITAVTDVSVFSINLVTALGLGLAIDYSLFVVSRFREELHAGRSVDDAVVRTVETAGRTVAFSALTVAASLSALLIFPLFFLRSFAYAGIGVILVAMLASLVSLPGSPDHRVLPEGNPAREVSESLREDFVSDEADAFPVVAIGEVGDGEVEAFAAELSAVAGVTRVDARTGRYADVGGPVDRGRHLRAAVRHVRLDPRAGEGPGPQHAFVDRHHRAGHPGPGRHEAGGGRQLVGSGSVEAAARALRPPRGPARRVRPRPVLGLSRRRASRRWSAGQSGPG